MELFIRFQVTVLFVFLYQHNIVSYHSQAMCFASLLQSFQGFDDPNADFEKTFKEVVKRLRQKFRLVCYIPGSTIYYAVVQSSCAGLLQTE